MNHKSCFGKISLAILSIFGGNFFHIFLNNEKNNEPIHFPTTFSQYHINQELGDKFDMSQTICLDNNIIFVGTHNDGLWRSIDDGKSFQEIMFPNIDNHRNNINVLYTYTFFNSEHNVINSIWIGLNTGQCFYSFDNGESFHVTIIPDSNLHILSITYVESLNTILLGTNSGIYIYKYPKSHQNLLSTQDVTFTKYVLTGSNAFLNKTAIAKTFVESYGDSFYLVLGTQGHSVWISLLTAEWKTNSFQQAGGINSDAVINDITNNNGLIWIATNHGLFTNHDLTEYTSCTSIDINANIKSIFYDRFDYSWAILANGEVWTNNDDATTFKKFVDLSDKKNQWNFIYQDNANNYWIGSKNSGLWKAATGLSYLFGNNLNVSEKYDNNNRRVLITTAPILIYINDQNHTFHFFWIDKHFFQHSVTHFKAWLSEKGSHIVDFYWNGTKTKHLWITFIINS